MHQLFIGNVLCIILSWLCVHFNKKWQEYFTFCLFIFTTILLRDHIAMSCLLGFGIGLVEDEHCLCTTKSKYFMYSLLICNSFMMCWGHHLIYMVINKYVMPLPKSLDAVAKWMAIYSTIFVFALNRSDAVKLWISKKTLVKFGKTSMGIYCFHNIMFGTVGYYIAGYLQNCKALPDVNFLITWMLVIISTIFMASIYESTFGKWFSPLLAKIK